MWRGRGPGSTAVRAGSARRPPDRRRRRGPPEQLRHLCPRVGRQPTLHALARCEKVEAVHGPDRRTGSSVRRRHIKDTLIDTRREYWTPTCRPTPRAAGGSLPSAVPVLPLRPDAPPGGSNPEPSHGSTLRASKRLRRWKCASHPGHTHCRDLHCRELGLNLRQLLRLHRAACQPADVAKDVARVSVLGCP